MKWQQKENGWHPSDFDEGLDNVKGLSRKKAGIGRLMMNQMDMLVQPIGMHQAMGPIEVSILNRNEGKN